MTGEVVAALLSAVATGFAVTAYSQTPPPAPALPEPPSTPAPNSITPQMAAQWRDWRHLPNPVSDEQLKQDKLYCAEMGSGAALGQGSPQITYDLTYLNCLRSKGYEPVLSTKGTTQSEAKPKAQGEAQGLSVEDRACITRAAGKLPKIATIEQSRVVSQPPQDQGRHERDLYHVKVEIDVSVAGQTSTYIFNCIHSGDLTVIQPLGMR
jgi:hypothetical protein